MRVRGRKAARAAVAAAQLREQIAGDTNNLVLRAELRLSDQIRRQVTPAPPSLAEKALMAPPRRTARYGGSHGRHVIDFFREHNLAYPESVKELWAAVNAVDRWRDNTDYYGEEWAAVLRGGLPEPPLVGDVHKAVRP